MTIDGATFDVLSTDISLRTVHDERGMPMMGSLACSFDLVIDMHDTDNLPFDTVSKLFNLSNLVTRDKIVDIAIAYWTDETQEDAICVYKFRGWVSKFNTLSGNGSNHTLNLSLQPTLAGDQFVKIELGN